MKNVHLPPDLQRVAPLLGVAVLAVAGLLLVTRVVGGGGGGINAAEVLQKGFTNEPRSAVLNLRFTGAFQASNGKSRRGTYTVVGPASDGPGAKDPGQADLKITDTSGGTPVTFRLISTGERGFVGYRGRFYRMSDRQFKSVFADGSSPDESFVEELGFDLQRWMTEPALAGTAKLDGVTNDRVTSKVDVIAMLTDLDVIGPGSDDAGANDKLFRDAAKDGEGQLLVGRPDGILRKADVTARVVARGEAATVNATFRFDLGLQDVNKPVKVKAPENALPPGRIKDIPRSVLGTSYADKLLGAKPGKRGRPRGDTREAGRSRKAYVNCVQQATDTAALEKCQALVP